MYIRGIVSDFFDNVYLSYLSKQMKQCDNLFWNCRSLVWKSPKWIDSHLIELEKSVHFPVFSSFWLIWINFETEFVQLFKFSLYCNKKALCLFLLIILKVKAVYSCRLFSLTRAIWTDWTIQFEPSMRTRLSRAWLFQLGNWMTIYLNCQVYFNRKIILSCGD